MLKARPLLALVPLSVARQLLAAGELCELPMERSLPFQAIGALVAAVAPPAGASLLLLVLRDVATSPQT